MVNTIIVRKLYTLYAANMQRLMFYLSIYRDLRDDDTVRLIRRVTFLRESIISRARVYSGRRLARDYIVNIKYLYGYIYYANNYTTNVSRR